MKNNKSMFKFALQWVALILVIAVINQFNLTWAYYVLGVFAFALIVSRVVSKQSSEVFIEISCDAPKYLENVEKKYKGKNENLYNLQTSYGLLHQGKEDEAFILFQKVDPELIDNKNRFFPIYIKMKTRELYSTKNYQGLKEYLESNVNESYMDENSKDYLKVFTLLADDRFEDAIDTMIVVIPKMKYRIHIIELEYYLADTYRKVGRKEDANAVAEYVAGKEFKIIYTEWCQSIVEELGINQ